MEIHFTGMGTVVNVLAIVIGSILTLPYFPLTAALRVSVKNCLMGTPHTPVDREK